MKKLFILIGIVLLALSTPTFSQEQYWETEFSTSDITGGDSLYIANPIRDYEDWFGRTVGVTIYVQNTDEIDAQLFVGGTDRLATSVIGVTEFTYESASGITVDPLVIDSTGLYLKPNTDTTWYHTTFNIDKFSSKTPAFWLIKNSLTTGDWYISFKLRK